MTSFRLVKPYFAKNAGRITLGILCLVGVDILQLLIPRIVKHAVDGLTKLQTDTDALMKQALLIMLAAVGIGILRYLWRNYLIGNSRHIEEGLRNQLFNHIQLLSASFFNRHKTGDLMAHATNDIMHIRMATEWAWSLSPMLSSWERRPSVLWYISTCS
jgi:ATP-binding cassette subfamily B multidrug efflux pump